MGHTNCATYQDQGCCTGRPIAPLPRLEPCVKILACAVLIELNAAAASDYLTTGYGRGHLGAQTGCLPDHYAAENAQRQSEFDLSARINGHGSVCKSNGYSDPLPTQRASEITELPRTSGRPLNYARRVRRTHTMHAPTESSSCS